MFGCQLKSVVVWREKSKLINTPSSGIQEKSFNQEATLVKKSQKAIILHISI